MTDAAIGEAGPGVFATDRRQAEWPLRPWLLAALFGISGLLIHFVTHEHVDVAWRVALAAFVLFAAVAAAFALEQGQWKAPALFALGIGLAAAVGLIAGALPAILAPLATLGRWSLSFYMLHQPVLIALLTLAATMRS